MTGPAVRPEPGPEVLAMISVAVDQVWPRPAVLAAAGGPDPAHRAWRFSGRWWSRPVPARRDRP